LCLLRELLPWHESSILLANLDQERRTVGKLCSALETWKEFWSLSVFTLEVGSPLQRK
jgi:hypothetical protein